MSGGEPVGDREVSDRAVRDEICHGASDETLFVNAGAGSGKTSALVSRIVHRVAEGVDVEKIAAITFTEAAAAELRLRVRRELQSRRSAADAVGDHSLVQVMDNALDRIDGAAIQTLHSFALGILRRFPIEAGLPPAVEVADDVTSFLRDEERRSALFDDLYASPEWAPYLERLFDLGRSTDDLVAVAAIFDANYDRLPAVKSERPAPILPLNLTALIGKYEAVLARRDECTNDGDKLLAHLTDKVAEHLSFLRSPDVATIVEALREPIGPGSGGSKSNWPDGACVDIKADLKRLQKTECADELSELGADALTPFVAHLAAVSLDAARQRRATGLLSFHDLLVIARDVLRCQPAVRRELHGVWDLIFVDEFQDTDPLQIELVTLIATTETELDGRLWDELPTAAGRLFFVGDPKQSIYRFRRASIELYRQVENLPAHANRTLSTNFRSVPGIIDFVNAVFEQLIVEADGSPPYQRLDPYRPALDGPPPVHVLGGPRPDNVAAIRDHAAEDLAAYIGRVVDERWMVEDPLSETLRPAELSDIVVLVPTRLAVPSLERAFSAAGLAYVLATRSLIWDSQEVREVLAVLRAINDGLDQVALVAALRTPAIGCSDADLVDWVDRDGIWSLARPVGALADHPVGRGIERLRRFRGSARADAVDTIVQRVVDELRSVEIALLSVEGRERWRRLRVLVDHAQSFVEQGGGGLHEFLAWIELQSSDVLTVAQPMIVETDNPAIRVMTVHGAKGLEFPVCALFGLTTGFSARPGVRMGWGSPGSMPEVSLSSAIATQRFNELVPLEDQLDAHERRRLLYVAATRARDHLIVCAHHKEVKEDKPVDVDKDAFGRILVGHLPEQGEGEWWHRVEDVAPRRHAEPEEPEPGHSAPDRAAGQPAPDQPASAAEALADFERAVAGRGVDPPTVRSATSIAVGHETPLDDRADGDPLAVGRGAVGPAIGRAVHGTLEVIDDLTRVDPSALAALARIRAGEEGLGEADAEVVVATVAAIVEHPEVRAVLDGRHWREVFVAAPVGDVADDLVVEGYVDLLGDDGAGGLVVLDYKSDLVIADADIDAKVARYRLQLGVYALALGRSTGQPVTGAGLVFVRDGVAEVRWIDDLDAAIEEVRGIVGSAS